MTNEYMFVYGTLMRGFALNDVMHEFCEFVSEARLPGYRLYRVRSVVFPTILKQDDAEVIGECWVLKSPIEMGLGWLDRVEGYNPTQPQSSMYNRVRVPITRLDTGEKLSSWVYEAGTLAYHLGDAWPTNYYGEGQ